MRIAYLCGTYPRATDTFIQREIEALREHGLSVVTYSVRKARASELVGAEQKREAKTTQHLLPCSLFELLAAHLGLLLSRPVTYLQTLWLAVTKRRSGLMGLLYGLFYFAEAGLLARKMERDQIAHLHNHLGCSSCSVAMLASSLTGIPFSFTLHGPYVFFDTEQLQLSEKIARASFVACISYFCRSQAMYLTDPKNWQKLHVIRCGVDPNQFHPKEHLGAGKQLLYVGRLSAAKGLPILLHALARLRQSNPAVVLTLVGDGEDRELIEEQIRELNLAKNVLLVGYESREGVLERLKEADVLVLPSFAEGLPVVLMEALAARVPVVTTQIAAVSELVEDGVNGRIVPPGNSDALAEAMAELLHSTELRARMGQRGREKVESEFTSSTQAQRLASLFSSKAGHTE